MRSPMQTDNPHAPTLAGGAHIEGLAAMSVVVVSKSSAALAKAWWDGLLAPTWPGQINGAAGGGGAGGGAPTPQWVSWEAATVDTQAFAALGRADVACVLVDPSSQEQEIRRVCASVREHAGGGVCVLPASHAHLAPAVASMGLLVHHDGRPPACLGSMLMGMADRQGVVRELQTELNARQGAQRQAQQLVSKLDGELLLAAKLQREVMRSDELTIPGIKIGILYRPAWYVSGDVYKFLRIDEKHIGVVLADAMGHGVSAAMYSMLIANSTTMKQTDTHSYRLIPPFESMEKLNHLLLQPDSETTRFATAVCALLNTNTGELLLASAGHPTALVVGPTGHATRIESTGPVLGVFDDATFGQELANLGKGQMLALYTDGIECVVGTHRVEDFLIRAIRHSAGDPASAIADIQSQLDKSPGSLAPQDDMTVLLIARENN